MVEDVAGNLRDPGGVGRRSTRSSASFFASLWSSADAADGKFRVTLYRKDTIT